MSFVDLFQKIDSVQRHRNVYSHTRVAHKHTYLRFIVPDAASSTISQVGVVTSFTSIAAVRMVPHLNINKTKNKQSKLMCKYCFYVKYIFFSKTGLVIEQGNSEGFDSCDQPYISVKLDSNRPFFSPCDLEIWWMILKNNRALLLYYVKLYVSFQIHRWIQTRVTARKRVIRIDILACVTLKFDGWPWKTEGHLFYTTSSFVHHFKSIGEVKLELQSGKAKFGSNSTIFVAMWP